MKLAGITSFGKLSIFGLGSKGISNNMVCSAEPVIKNSFIIKHLHLTTSWKWPHEVHSQEECLISYYAVRKYTSFRVTGQWFGVQDIQLSIYKSLTKVGVFEDRSISIAAIIAYVHKGEMIIWINQSHKHNREGPLVIEEEATRFTWSLNHNVFPIQCPNAVGKVPSSMKPPLNLYPIFFCRWRHFHGLQFFPDNLACMTEDSVDCCNPQPKSIGQCIVGISGWQKTAILNRNIFICFSLVRSDDIIDCQSSYFDWVGYQKGIWLIRLANTFFLVLS